MKFQAHGGPLGFDQTRRLRPFPGRFVSSCQVPAARDMALAPARLSQHLLADEQAELDAHSGETDPLAASLGAGGEVVVADQIATPHASPVIHDGQIGLRGIDSERDVVGSRVERVGHNLREDGLL